MSMIPVAQSITAPPLICACQAKAKLMHSATGVQWHWDASYFGAARLCWGCYILWGCYIPWGWQISAAHHSCSSQPYMSSYIHSFVHRALCACSNESHLSNVELNTWLSVMQAYICKFVCDCLLQTCVCLTNTSAQLHVALNSAFDPTTVQATGYETSHLATA